MKKSLKYILLLLCLAEPLISQAQVWADEMKDFEEERIAWNNNHSKGKEIISLSEFVKGLKLASEQKKDYTLKNCAIIYNKTIDEKYVSTVDSEFYKNLKVIIVNENISFLKGSSVTLSNCLFLADDEGGITLKNIHFWNLNLINIASSMLNLDSIDVHGKLNIQKKKKGDFGGWSISSSNINFINIRTSDAAYTDKEKTSWSSLENNRIGYCRLVNFGNIRIYGNDIGYLSLSGKLGIGNISDNNFHLDFRNTDRIRQSSNNEIHLNVLTGIKIRSAEIDNLKLFRNTSTNIEHITNDSLISIIKRFY